jgi:hypothetical protein
MRRDNQNASGNLPDGQNRCVCEHVGDTIGLVKFFAVFRYLHFCVIGDKMNTNNTDDEDISNFYVLLCYNL